jgi:hypothetical protein
MLTPKIAATGISVSCGSWWRESNVPNATAGKSPMMALVVTAGVLQRAAPGVDFRAVVRDLGAA